MPLSRDPRMDRRKRILRESLPADQESASSAVVRTRTRRSAAVGSEDNEEPPRRRSAGYSQDVRGACQHRLVQLIPVRRRTYLLAVFASCFVPALLLLAHYWIYVTGYLKWYGQPLALLLDASHPRGIAAWMTGQMWLLCLASTVLTFRLRRHKLDDYNGDYRLWFWLVSTCIIGSLDSTTRVTDVFGDALNRWSQLNLGWSGPAVVQATLATLVGMLGLRLCSELKAVPTSLLFWLFGLVAWAGSAALGQELLKLDMSIQFRIWLRSALWIVGLTSIWLASLSYLRVVYIEAQRRFLLRGRLAASLSSTWKERLTESMPTMPTMPSFRLRRPAAENLEDTQESRTTRQRRDQIVSPEAKPRWFGLPKFMKRRQPLVTDTVLDKAVAKERGQDVRAEQRSEQPRGTQREPLRADAARPEPRQTIQTGGPLAQARRLEPTTTAPGNAASGSAVPSTLRAAGPIVNPNKESSREAAKKAVDDAAKQPAARRSWLGRLVSQPNSSDDAAEYRKVDKVARAAEQLAAKNDKLRLKEEQRQALQAVKASGRKEAGSAPVQKQGWLPKLSIPKLRLPSLPRPKLPKLSLPKLKLPSLRLPPPETREAIENRPPSKPENRPLPSAKPLPSTNGPAQEALESGGRPLSKAERKRMKRMQDDQDYDIQDRRAA